ncbi:MAG: hypothetical protein ACK6DC_17355 [Planctomycetota bacterium]
MYHSALVDAQVPFEFSLGLKNGDRNHGLRDEAMQSVHRVGHRKAAMQASQSITSTSTVRRGGLSTSTMGVGSLSTTTVAITKSRRTTLHRQKRQFGDFGSSLGSP